MNNDEIIKAVKEVEGDQISFFKENPHKTGRPAEIKPPGGNPFWTKESLISAIKSGTFGQGTYQVGKYGIKGAQSRKKILLNLEVETDNLSFSGGGGPEEGERDHQTVEIPTTTPDYVVALLGNQLGNLDRRIDSLWEENALLRKENAELKVEIERIRGESKVKELEDGDSLGRLLSKAAEGKPGEIVAQALLEKMLKSSAS